MIKSYDLNLDVDFRRSVVKGIVAITVVAAEDPFVIDAVDMEVSGVTVRGKECGFSHNLAKGKLVIRGVPSTESEVTLQFRKRVRDDVIFGLYKSRYSKGHLLVTDLEPAEARTVFPCVDEPSYKAVFRLSVSTDKGLSAISNTPAVSQRVEGSRVRFVFRDTPRMSTYLFFLGIGKFEERKTEAGEVKVIAASRPGQGKDSGFIRRIAGQVLREYEKYFGIPYPLPKLHLVGLPEYHTGAMENWGAITAREHYVVLRSDASDSERRNAARIMAHEIAHQWFGDLVTMKWWDDVWLNESFATFMEAKVLDRLRPEWDTWREFLRSDTFRSLNADALASTHPIQANVKSVEEIGSIFDAISYGKGASVLRMLETYIGEDAFRRGISAYLKKFAYANASGEDLWASLAAASGKPVAKVAKAWITQSGFPLVRMKSMDGVMSMSQEKFSLSHKKSDELWPIPLTILIDGKNQSMLFGKRSTSVRVSQPGRTVVNPQRTGFYSVLYDDETYRRMAKSFSSIDSHDRAGIVNDLYLMLQAGIVRPDKYFTFANLSGRLVDPLLALTVGDHFVNLRAIAGESEVVAAAWTTFFRSQVRLVGLTKKTGEDANLGIAREAVASQLAKTDRAFAKRLAKNFAGFGSVDANLKTAVATGYATVEGNGALGPLLELLKTSESEADRAKLYAALTSFADPKLVRNVLDFTLSGEVSRSDIGYALFGASSNPMARGVLWKWTKSRYDELKRLYGGSQQFYLYLNVIIPRCGVGQVADVHRFISGSRYEDGKMTFKRAFELLEVNSRLRRTLVSR